MSRTRHAPNDVAMGLLLSDKTKGVVVVGVGVAVVAAAGDGDDVGLAIRR